MLVAGLGLEQAENGFYTWYKAEISFLEVIIHRFKKMQGRN